MRIWVDNQIAEGPFDSPNFRSPEGTASQDPDRLLNGNPKFSCEKLALYFCGPSLDMEFIPEAPWEGLTIEHPSLQWPPPSELPLLVDKFRFAITECIGSAETVAVNFSGGLDSLAVLYHTASLCRKQGLRAVAIVNNVVDDLGIPAATVADNLIRDLSISCELEIVEETEIAPRLSPTWSPVGPIFNAMPKMTLASNVRAQECGATVLLSGLGGDELLRVPSYLGHNYLSRLQLFTLASYLRDRRFAGDVAGLWGEFLAMLSRVLPSQMGFHLYLSCEWPDLVIADPGQVINRRHLEFVREWLHTWARDRFALYKEQRTWSLALAWDSVYPHGGVTQLGEVEERSPFLQSSFALYALGIPLPFRYSPEPHFPYHRRKALVLRLLPIWSHRFLPKKKQIYSRAQSEYLEKNRPSESPSVDLKILRSDLVIGSHPDRRISLRVQAVDEWIRGALDFGATPV